MDISQLAANNNEMAELIELADEITPEDCAVVVQAFRDNAKALDALAREQSREPAPILEATTKGEQDTKALVALRDFHSLFNPLREGRSVNGLQCRESGEVMGRAWMAVESTDYSAKLMGIVKSARAVAKRWAAVTPPVWRAPLPELVHETRWDSQTKPSELSGKKERFVKGEDLTSFQRAQLKIRDVPPDLSAMQDGALAGLVYALVNTVKGVWDETSENPVDRGSET